MSLNQEKGVSVDTVARWQFLDEAYLNTHISQLHKSSGFEGHQWFLRLITEHERRGPGRILLAEQYTSASFLQWAPEQTQRNWPSLYSACLFQFVHRCQYRAPQGHLIRRGMGRKRGGGGGWEALWCELRRNCVQHQASGRGRHRGGSTSYGRKTGKSKLKESRKCIEKRLQWRWRSSNTESKTHKEHA